MKIRLWFGLLTYPHLFTQIQIHTASLEKGVSLSHLLLLLIMRALWTHWIHLSQCKYKTLEVICIGMDNLQTLLQYTNYAKFELTWLGHKLMPTFNIHWNQMCNSQYLMEQQILHLDLDSMEPQFKCHSQQSFHLCLSFHHGPKEVTLKA